MIVLTDEQKEYYGKYAEPLDKACEKIMGRLDDILSQLTSDPEMAPFEHILSRIKSPESVIEKLRIRGDDTTAYTALTALSDIIGIRVVTHFIGDIYTILDRLKEAEDIEIVNVKDYIATPKENGYRSLHVILKVDIDSEDIKKTDIEIQLRTIAMDCWASLEHQMRYKKDVKDTMLIASELKRCADEMASSDLTMQTIRDVLQKKE